MNKAFWRRKNILDNIENEILKERENIEGFNLRILLYGDNITNSEKNTAQMMANNLKETFGAKSVEIEFTKPVWEGN